MTWNHPTGRSPQRVTLLCLGPTRGEWTAAHLGKHHPLGDMGPGGSLECDELWTLNRGVTAFPWDVAFVLDDLRNEASLDPDYGRKLRILGQGERPLITSTPYPEYPNALAYPLREVCELLTRTHTYLDNSVPMIIAYAVLVGVRDLAIFGADYTGGGEVLEQNRANTEYMIAWARCQGVGVGVPTSSSITNANRPGPNVYGHLAPPPAYVHWLRHGWWPEAPFDPCFPPTTREENAP